MFYFKIMKQLFEQKIEYLIIGGLAVNLYGIPRVTQDIDIIISMDKKNILKINELFKSLGFIPRLPVNPNDLANRDILELWIKKKNLKAFSFYNKKENYKVIDILVDHPLNFKDAYRDKTIKKVRNIEIYLASINDLITLKQNTGREQDISDIKLLKKLKRWMEEDNE